MTSLISAAPVSTGQFQSLDGLRAHALPSDAMIYASGSLVNPANQNPGSYAIVESGINSLGVTATGSVPAVTQSPFADLYKEGSIYLNGVSGNYLQNTAVYSNTTIQWSTTGMTVEAWVNYPTFSGGVGTNATTPTATQIPYTFGMMTSGGSVYWSFGSNVTGYTTFYYYNNSTLQSVIAQTPLSANTWNHIAMTCSTSGQIFIFINGVQSQIVANRNGTLQAAAYYESVQGTPATTSAPLSLGSGGGANPTVYIADVRLTTGTPLYTGSTSSYATFTVPSAPLSPSATGATQFLLRAGQNSPTIQSGALTFDRGLKQYIEYGPQTFNLASQGFTAVFKFKSTGTVGSFERIFEFGNNNINTTTCSSIAAWHDSQNLYFYLYPAGSATGTGAGTTSSIYGQNTTFIGAARYDPVAQLMTLWVNGVQVASASFSSPSDRTLAVCRVGGDLNGTNSTSPVSQVLRCLNGTMNTFAVYNRALSNTEIYNSYLALTTTPATPLQKTLEIGDNNGTPALSVAGDGKVFMDSVGLTSNVVPWPPAAMTGYDTVINGGVYKARASTEYSSSTVPAWYAFDKNTSTFWNWNYALGNYYPGGAGITYGNYTGPVTTTDVQGTVYKGEWIQLQLPTRILLSSYTVYGANIQYDPGTFFVLGSNDGLNWTLVSSQVFVPWTTSPQTLTFQAQATQTFSYFRMVIGAIMSSGTNNYSLPFGEWTLYGTADTSPSLTISPATTFSSSVATPALTGIAGDRYVPQDFSSSGLNIPAYVVSNTATAANTVAFSSFGPFAGEGSLYFPGGTGAYVNFGNQLPVWTGSLTDATFEAWVYIPLYLASTDTIFVRAASLTSGGYDFLFYVTSTGGLSFIVYGANGTPYTGSSSNGTVPLNTWTHVAATLSSGVVRVFVNGTVGGTTASMSGVTTPRYTASNLTLIGNWQSASNQMFNGYIASARIVSGHALYTGTFTPPTGPLQPIQGVTQSGTPYGTVLLLRNAPAPGRIQTTKFSGANSGSVLSFPPAAMTTYATALSSGYGQGTYVASASNEFDTSTNTLWHCFDKSTASIWTGDGSSYTSGNYTKSPPVTTVDVNGTSYQGEWIQLLLPSSIVLSSYQIAANGTTAPKQFYLFGSRDGVSWTLVDQRSNQTTWTSGVYVSYPVSSAQAFTYLRFVTNQTNGSSSYVQIQEIIYNGSIESINVTADGRVGLGVVAPTRALEVAGDVVSTGTVSSGTGFMFRNKIINGDMRFNQRGGASGVAGTAGTSAVGYVGTDRWKVVPAITTGAIQQLQLQLVSSDLPFQYGFKYSTRWTASTALSNYLYVAIMQFVELANWSDMAWMGSGQGSPCTLSFWFRAKATGQYCYAIRNTAASIQSWVGTFNVGAADTWGFYQFTIPPPGGSGATWNNASTTDGLQVQIGGVVKTNTTSTPNTWSAPGSAPETASGYVDWPATLNNYIEFTGVQLEKGTVATPFEVRPYATELQLCQRYMFQLSAGDTAPCYQRTSTLITFFVRFPVTIRTPVNPTLSGSINVSLGSTDTTQTSISAPGGLSAQTVSSSAYQAPSAQTIGTAGNIQVNSSSYIRWDAEL